MNTLALLRKSADLLEVVPISPREEAVIELMTYHILRILGDEGHAAEEAKLLCQMLYQA